MIRCNWPCRPMRWLVSYKINKHHVLHTTLGNMLGKPLIDPPCHSQLKFYFLQVDKHIRRLDTDLARFEADLKEKQIESTDYDSTSSKGKKGVCPLH